MANPVILAVAGTALDADGVALAQAVGSATDLTLSGVTGSGNISGVGIGQIITVTSAGNDSGITFTIYGTNPSGNAISQTITGANAGVASTTVPFRSVTRVASSAAAAGNVSVGWTAVAYSRWLVLDYFAVDFQVGIGFYVSGTVDYDLEYTYDDPDGTVVPTVFVPTALDGKTAAADGSLSSPVRAVRVKVNSGTGTATATVIQTGTPGA
jgi:hypothetical protein